MCCSETTSLLSFLFWFYFHRQSERESFESFLFGYSRVPEFSSYNEESESRKMKSNVDYLFLSRRLRFIKLSINWEKERGLSSRWSKKFQRYLPGTLTTHGTVSRAAKEIKYTKVFVPVAGKGVSNVSVSSLVPSCQRPPRLVYLFHPFVPCKV